MTPTVHRCAVGVNMYLKGINWCPLLRSHFSCRTTGIPADLAHRTLDESAHARPSEHPQRVRDLSLSDFVHFNHSEGTHAGTRRDSMTGGLVQERERERDRVCVCVCPILVLEVRRSSTSRVPFEGVFMYTHTDQLFLSSTAL